MAAQPEQRRPVGRPRKSDLEKKKRKEMQNRIGNLTRVHLGSEIYRWNDLKEELGDLSNKELAKLLLDLYYSPRVKNEQGEFRLIPTTSTPAQHATLKQLNTRLSTTQDTELESGKFGMMLDSDVSNESSYSENRPAPNIYAIRGLPMNTPFTVHFTSPWKEDDLTIKYDSKAYIMLEYSTLKLDMNIKPLCINIEECIIETLESVILYNLHDDITNKNNLNTWVERRQIINKKIKHDKPKEFVRDILDSIVNEVVANSEKKEEQGSNGKKRKQKNVKMPESTTTKRIKKGSANDHQVEFDKQKKLVKLDEQEMGNDDSFRKSSRIRSKGFRPDYSAYDDLNDISDLDLESSDEDDVSGNEENAYRTIIVKTEPIEEINEFEAYRHGNEENVSMDSSTIVAKGGPIENLHKHDLVSKIVKACMVGANNYLDDKNKSCESVNECAETMPVKTKSSDEGMVDCEDQRDNNEDPDNMLKTPESAKGAGAIKNKKKTTEMDSDPDFDIDEYCSGGKRKSYSSGKKSKKPVPHYESDEDSEYHSTDSDNGNENDAKNTDGICQIETKKMKARMAKMRKRIKIKLEDHTDKYNLEDQESVERKDRGKSKEEKLTKLYVCTVCDGFRTENKVAIEVHIEGHVNGDFNCDKCDFTASTKYHVQMHKTYVHKKKRHVCSECGEKFALRSALNKHLQSDHKIPVYICQCCSTENDKMLFDNRGLLTMHYRSHHEEKMVKCEKCDMLFPELTKLHVRKCHGKLPYIACHICGKLIRGEAGIKAHTKHVHMNIRQYPCSQCNYAAKSACNLRDHITSKHEGKRNFQCDQCDFSCVQSFQLVSHQRTHTGDKPFKCDKCSYSAAWNVQLKDHKKLHGLACSVTCDTCGIILKNVKSYNLHMKKEHPDDSKS